MESSSYLLKRSANYSRSLVSRLVTGWSYLEVFFLAYFQATWTTSAHIGVVA